MTAACDPSPPPTPPPRPSLLRIYHPGWAKWHLVARCFYSPPSLTTPSPHRPTSSGRRRPTRRARQLLSGAKARGEWSNEAARPALPDIAASLPLSGDRCECLTRSGGGRVPIKSLCRPSRGPSRPLTPLRAVRIPARRWSRITEAPHYQDLGQHPSPPMWVGVYEHPSVFQKNISMELENGGVQEKKKYRYRFRNKQTHTH